MTPIHVQYDSLILSSSSRGQGSDVRATYSGEKGVIHIRISLHPTLCNTFRGEINGVRRIFPSNFPPYVLDPAVHYLTTQ